MQKITKAEALTLKYSDKRSKEKSQLRVNIESLEVGDVAIFRKDIDYQKPTQVGSTCGSVSFSQKRKFCRKTLESGVGIVVERLA